MQSQMQCPVCTLFLHVGMNLQVHLDTHPKDQVIQALVNLTVTQQQTNDNDLNTMQCSRYAPLLDEPVVITAHKDAVDSKSSIGYYPEPRQQQQQQQQPPQQYQQKQQQLPPPSLAQSSSRHHQQVVIVNSCSTSVFREGSTHPSSSTSAQQIITNRIPITSEEKTLEIARRPPPPLPAPVASKQISIVNLIAAPPPPPPPYDCVPHIHRQYINRNKSIAIDEPSQIPESNRPSAEQEQPINAEIDDEVHQINHENISEKHHHNDEVTDVCFVDDFESEECDETMKVDVDDEPHYHQSRPSSPIILDDDDDDDYDDENGNNENQPVRPNSVIHFIDYNYTNDEPILQITSSSKEITTFPIPIPPPNNPNMSALQPFQPMVSGRRKSSLRILSNVRLDPIYNVFGEYKLANTTLSAAILETKNEPEEEVFDLDATDGTMSLKSIAMDEDCAERQLNDDVEEGLYETVTMVPAALTDVRKNVKSMTIDANAIELEQSEKVSDV